MSKWKKDIEELLDISIHRDKGRLRSFRLDDMEGASDENKKKIDNLEREVKDDIRAILDYFNLEFVYIPKTPEIPASLKLQPRKKNVKKVDK